MGSSTTAAPATLVTVEEVVAAIFAAGIAWGLYLLLARPERFFASDG